MANYLNGQIRKAIGKGFKNKLLKGTLSRATSGGRDENGDVIEGVPETFVIEGFISNYDDAYRVAAGIPATDCKVVLILANCETEPLKQDTVSFPNWPTVQLRNVKIDPARASATCQAFDI